MPIKVVNEVEILRDKYGMEEIFFQDDTFNLNHAWAMEIFDEIIKRKIKMLFRICCRTNEKLVTENFLKKAAQAGVWCVFYGLESGSQAMLDRMNKKTTVREAERAIKMTHDAGMKTQCSLIIGLPGESRKTLRETQAFLDRVRPCMAGISPACPFPDTELDRIVTINGHKKDIPYEEYQYGKVVVRTDNLDFGDFETFGGFSYQPAYINGF
jgi:radical SAM superfamily enzyme YgiQ (UPF0313 family)